MTQIKVGQIETARVCELKSPDQMTIQINESWYSPLHLADCLRLRATPAASKQEVCAELFEQGRLASVPRGSLSGNFDK
jgi:hypothetical protein